METSYHKMANISVLYLYQCTCRDDYIVCGYTRLQKPKAFSCKNACDQTCLLYCALFTFVDHYLRNTMCWAWRLHCSWDRPRWPSHWWHNNILCSGGVRSVVLSPAGIWPRNPWWRLNVFITLLLIHVGYYFCKWCTWWVSQSFPGEVLLTIITYI